MTDPIQTHGLKSLNLKPIDKVELKRIRDLFNTVTLPKIKAETKRNARAVAIARHKVAYR